MVDATELLWVTELSAWRLCAALITRRRPYILGVDPILSPLRRPLDAAIAALERRGHVRNLTELLPDIAPFLAAPDRTLLYDVFGAVEPWQRAHFRFGDADRLARSYAQAYKHTVSTYLGLRETPLIAAKWAKERFGETDIRLVGLGHDLSAAEKAYSGRSPKKTPALVWAGAALINLLVAAIPLIFGLLWVIARIRPLAARPRCYAFGADYISDPDDVSLYRELAELSPILLVARTSAHETPPQIVGSERYVVSSLRNGAFSGPGTVDAIRMLACDTMRLWRSFAGLSPTLFYQIASLPFRRVRFRALFNVFRPRIFWSRDFYNADHILRRMELNRVASQSWGVLHTVPPYSPIYPTCRYLSYDVYFVMGLDFYLRHYRDTWPTDMRVVATTSFRMPRDILAQRSNVLPPDILILVSIIINEPTMAQFVRGLSERFPDRSILLQIKGQYTEEANVLGFVEACQDGLANVVLVTGPVYSLFPRARYVFSDPSTAALEAAQFGAFGFVADVSRIQRSSYFRSIPGLCVADAADASERIRGIEDGSRPYEIDAVGSAIDLSGVAFADTVRRELGLPPRELAPLI